MSLVGTEGVRALTHGRVDAAASLPPGSTSNHFRTRAALMTGVIEWIARQERSDAEPPRIHTRDDFVASLTGMIEAQSGRFAVRTRARYALFLEADEETTRPLREQRAGMEGWVRSILLDLGGDLATTHTVFMMATCDGLLLHRISVDPDAPVEAVIRRAVDAALRD